TQYGILEELVFFGHSRDGHFFRDYLARGFPNGYAVTMGRAHHDAFHHCLPANEGLLSAFQNRKHLYMGKKPEKRANRHLKPRILYYTWTGPAWNRPNAGCALNYGTSRSAHGCTFMIAPLWLRPSWLRPSRAEKAADVSRSRFHGEVVKIPRK